MKEVIQEVRFRGLPICQGIAVGHLLVVEHQVEEVDETTLNTHEVELEVDRFRRAVKRSCEDLHRLQKQLEKESVYEGAAILDTHLQIMQDPVLTSQIEYNIRETQRNAEFVFTRVIQETEIKFEAIQDPFFRERSKDVQDVSRRVMGHLKEHARLPLNQLPPGSIVLMRDMTPSEVAEASHDCVAGFITQYGSDTSHASIMARAKGIPCVSNLDYVLMKSFQDCRVVLDGDNGELIINPSEETFQAYLSRQKEAAGLHQEYANNGAYAAETFDGYQVRLSANIDIDQELDLLHQFGGDGVGLCRSESIFVQHQAIPDEEEQYRTYSKFVSKMRGLPIVIRVFDVGGDKGLHSKQFETEVNPFLGCRAIRFLLKEKLVFKTQLRAILRAAAGGRVSLMFPMISSLTELREAKALLAEVQEELQAQGIAVPANIRVGCMIEVPSAAIIADLLAKECDFLSIGTNDLVQYALAVDRGNNALRSFYTPAHPSVIRLIKWVVIEANRRGIPVSVCGEVAADPVYTPLLLGLGVHELSVAARALPAIKQAIRSISIVEASALADKALKCASSQEILQLLGCSR